MSNETLTQLMELQEAPSTKNNAITTQPQTPSAIMALAIQQGSSIEIIERMWTLQVRYEEREAEKAYNQAFSAFKAEAVRIIKNRTVKDGPLKGKGYAELHAVVNAATPALSLHGLSASWKLTKDEKDWIEVTCLLKHIGGHVESVSMGGPPDVGGAKNAIQARASTVSYLERYTLKAITGLSEQGEDDDARGNAIGDNKADECREAWIANVNSALNDQTLMRTWKMALEEIEPLNRMDVYSAVKDAVTAKRKSFSVSA